MTSALRGWPLALRAIAPSGPSTRTVGVDEDVQPAHQVQPRLGVDLHVLHAVHHARDLAEDLPGGAARRAEGAGELDQGRPRRRDRAAGPPRSGRHRPRTAARPGQTGSRAAVPATRSFPCLRRQASAERGHHGQHRDQRYHSCGHTSYKARDGRWHSARPLSVAGPPAPSAGTKVASCRLPAVTSKPCTCEAATHEEPGYQAVAAPLATVQAAAARCTPCASVTQSWHVVPVGHAGDLDVHRRAPRLLVVPDRRRDAAQRTGGPGRLPARGGRGRRGGLAGRCGTGREAQAGHGAGRGDHHRGGGRHGLPAPVPAAPGGGQAQHGLDEILGRGRAGGSRLGVLTRNAADLIRADPGQQSRETRPGRPARPGTHGTP